MKNFEWAERAGARFLKVGLPVERDLVLVGSVHELVNFGGRDRLLWVSGGGCYVLNGEWIPLVRRSAASSSNRGKITICSGRADSPAELYNPALIFRELFEEIVVIADDGTVIIPEIVQDPDESDRFDRERLTSIIEPLMRRNGIPYKGFTSARSSFRHDVAVDHVEVRREGQLVSRTQCLVHQNANTGEVNILRAVDISLGARDLESLRFFDTEFGFIDGAEQPLRRDVYLFHIPTGDLIFTQPGWSRRSKPVNLPMTPHAAHLIDAIRRNHFS